MVLVPVGVWGNRGGAFVFCPPGRAVVVNRGIGAVVWLGNAATVGAAGVLGVLKGASKDVLVGDGRAEMVDVPRGALV